MSHPPARIGAMPARSRGWILDRTPVSTVALCGHCGQRFLAARPSPAARALLAHLRAGHPDLIDTHSNSLSGLRRVAGAR